MKYLFLDDERVPSDVTWVPIGTGKSFHESRGAPWEIVRSYDEAINWVLKNGIPNVISFDHDLGWDEQDRVIGKTGYDFARWLVEYDLDTNTMPVDFSFTVHSMNPIGARNIKSLLDNYLMRK